MNILVNTIIILSLFISCSSGQKKEPKVFKTIFNDLTQRTIASEPPRKCSEKDAIVYDELTFDGMEVITTNNKSYSFEFLDMSIKEALSELSIQTNINIVVDEEIQGNLNLILNNKTPIQILEMILATGPYDYKVDNKFIYVGIVDIKSPSWWRLTYSRHYKVLNSSPLNILKQIPKDFHRFIEVDNDKSEIMITSSQKILKKIYKQIQKIDIPQKQIKLNLTISEVSSSGKTQLGSVLKSSESVIGEKSFDTQDGFFSLSSIPFNHFSKLMNAIIALKHVGELELKANPSIIVSEGEIAKFSSKISDIGNQGQFNRNRKEDLISVGVFVDIKPTLTRESDILLDIQNLELGDFHRDEKNPNIQEHKLSTKLKMKQGESLIIGGMLKSKSNLHITKIPTVSDIPLVGWFLKNKKERQETTEIIFIIKPEVICN